MSALVYVTVLLYYFLLGKGVCRSLFSRSHSVSYEVGSKRKREPDEVERQGAKKPKGLRTHKQVSSAAEFTQSIAKGELYSSKGYCNNTSSSQFISH